MSAVERLRAVVASSLVHVPTLYIRLGPRVFRFDGPHPGEGWHAHGYFARQRWILTAGKRERVVVWKRRFLLAGTTSTVHARPPDEAPHIHSCLLLVLLRLWVFLEGDAVWLDPDRAEALPDLETCGSDRTLRRWMRRATARALETQQAIRHALIERSEPRPVETLFPSGLPPPGGWLRRRWRDPPAVEALWRGCALLFLGAAEFGVHAAVLLAEARGRFGGPDRPFVL